MFQSFFMAFLSISALTASAAVQSEFKGPVHLKVWQHWQQSWNVEDVTRGSFDFLLIRGTDYQNSPYVSLKLKKSGQNLSAKLICDGYVRTGEWSVETKPGSAMTVTGQQKGEWAHFDFRNAAECLDAMGQRIVTQIQFEVFSDSQSIYQYGLKPMYVRGAKNSYWNNPIDPHSAHAGQGEINVATGMSAESGWDKWNGHLVRPTLNFVDRNTLKANSVIGLHRHESNQELYLIESGTAKMTAGVASAAGDIYTATRTWDRSGKTQDTKEFQARGGWIEERTLNPGEISVIVPSPAETSSIYFHGIEALSDMVFWTMGSKN